MRLRQMATAFIYNNDQVLMMKKKRNKLFDFEFWTALGGHIDPLEINDPQKAVLREIKEESDLDESDLRQLELRYVLKRLKDDEIRIQYVFFWNDRTEKDSTIGRRRTTLDCGKRDL